MGTYTYIQNVRIPGMLHARSVRPRGAGANTVENAKPLSVDATSIAHIPGAQVVQVNDFLAVVAPKEYDAIQAAAQLKVTWETKQGFPASSGNFWSWLRTAGDTNTTNPPRFTADSGSLVEAGLASAAKTVTATYKYHYNGFMPIGPHAAVADVKADGSGATVYVQAQAINGIPAQISTVLSLLPKPVNIPAANIRVIWYEGASSFGGGQTAEVNEQAAVISAMIGKPVRVQWMRWDQHGWDHYGVANMFDVTMGADATGKITAANWQSYGQVQSNIDETRRALGQVTWPATPGNGGLAPMDGGSSQPYSNTGYTAAYQYPRRVLAKTQPLYGGALKCNFLRAPNAPQQFFASEQIVDEMAHAVNMDPVAFRRKNIDPTNVIGARYLAVLDGATIAAGWKPKVAASNLQSGNVVKGRGFGFGLYANSQVGIVADVTVNKTTGKVREPPLRRPEQRHHDRPAARRQPDERLGDPGSLPRDVGAGDLEQGAGHEPRLGLVSDPPLQGPPEAHARQRPPGRVPLTITRVRSRTDVTKGNTAAFNQGWSLTGSGEPPFKRSPVRPTCAMFGATNYSCPKANLYHTIKHLRQMKVKDHQSKQSLPRTGSLNG